MEEFEFDLKRLIDERHSREAEPFKELIERYNRVSSSYDRVSSQLGETWRLLSTENGEGTIAEKITSMADDLEMAVETEGGDSKLHISYYKREKELQNLRESNEALTMKLLEISEQRATEMNEELLSRRIVENLPKYKRTSDKKGWILHLTEGLVYSPHSSEGTQILDSSICDDFLLTAANDGIVTLARIEMGEGGRDDRKSITLEQNAAVQACHSTVSLCHHYSGGKRLLIASCSECSVRIYSLSPSLSMDKEQLLFHFTLPAPSRPTSTCFLSPSRLALGTSDGYLRVYDFSGEGGMPRRETNTRLCEGSLLSLSLSTDSTRLAVADSNSRVHVLLFTAGDHSKVSVILDGYETRTGQDAMSRAALSFHPYNPDMLAVTRVGGDSIDIIDVGSGGRALQTLVTSSSTHRCLTSGAAWCPTFPGISIVAGVAGGGGNSVAVWQVTDSRPQRLSSSTPTRILPYPSSDGGGPITGALWGPQFLAVHNQIGNFFFFT